MIKTYNKFGFIDKEDDISKPLEDLEEIKEEQKEAKWNTILNKGNSYKNYLPLLPDIVYGVPIKMRGKLWLKFSRSEEVKCRYPHGYFETLLSATDSSCCDQIRLDLARTFTNHKLFIEGTLITPLFNVLKCYSLLFPQIGYCQGMAFVCATLLMNIDNVEDCLWIFVSMMEGLIENTSVFNPLKSFYEPKMRGMLDAAKLFEIMLQNEIPEVYNHLKNNNIDSLLYLTQWAMTLFTNLPNWNIVLTIFDFFMLEGTSSIFRFALAILKCCKDELLKKNGIETILPFLLNLPVDKIHENLVSSAFQIDIPLLMNKAREVAKAEDQATIKKRSFKFGLKNSMEMVRNNINNTVLNGGNKKRKMNGFQQSPKRSALSPRKENSPSNKYIEKIFYPTIAPTIFDDTTLEDDKENAFFQTSSFQQFRSPVKFNHKEEEKLKKIGIVTPIKKIKKPATELTELTN